MNLTLVLVKKCRSHLQPMPHILPSAAVNIDKISLPRILCTDKVRQHFSLQLSHKFRPSQIQGKVVTVGRSLQIKKSGSIGSASNWWHNKSILLHQETSMIFKQYISKTTTDLFSLQGGVDDSGLCFRWPSFCLHLFFSSLRSSGSLQL